MKPAEPPGPEEKYRAVFDIADDGISIVDPETRTIVDVNQAMCDMYGYSQEEFRSLDPVLLFSNDEPRTVQKAHEKLEAAAAGRPQLFDWHARHRDGHTFWVQVSLKRMSIQGRDYLLSIVRDVTERKKIEQELSDSKASLEQAQQIAGLGSWRWDERTGLVTSSDEALRILGTDQRQMTTEEFLGFVHPEDRARVIAAIQASEQAGAPFREEFRFLRPDGTVRWVQSQGKTVARNHNPLYIFGTVQNITERKQFEQELQESAADLAQAQELAHLGSWRWDIRRDILKMSDEGYRIMGLKPGEIGLDYSTFLSFIHPGDREAMETALEASLENGELYRQTHRLQRRDGSVRWVRCMGKTLFEDGRPTVMYGTMHDITERKVIEDRLRQRDLEVTTLLDSLDAFVFMKNAAGVYAMVNKRLCEAVGRTKEEIVGKTDYDLYPRDLADRYRAQDRAVIESGEPIMVPEDRTLDHGRYIEIAARKVPLGDGKGRVIGVIGVGFDITEIKNAERAADEARAQAELFLDLMGHDINNMNQVALGYLEMAVDRLMAGERIGPDDIMLVRKPLETLESTSSLIQNVKKLQQAKSGGMATRPVDLGEVLARVREQALHAPGREITIDYRPALGLLVAANELIHDLFSNIVTNAVKHSDPSRHLRICIAIDRIFEAGQEYYKVSIDDNGPGIPDARKRQIFDRIQRGGRRPGTGGLGLYLVTTLARRFGGRIWAEDRVPGDYTQGSRFVVMLPALRAGEGTGAEARA